MYKKEYLNLKVEINDLVIMNFKGLITQSSIVDLAKTVESTLHSFYEEETKIRTIFEIIIEIMQNMLSYSYDSVDLGDNTYQSNGDIRITLNKSTHTYLINSGNLINVTKRESIQNSLDEINTLNFDELKEAYKERRRSRRRNHGRGAGLGFLDIARKSKNKLEYNFLENDENSLMFNLVVKL